MALTEGNETDYESPDYYEELEGERAIWQLTKNYFRIFCKVFPFSSTPSTMIANIFVPRGNGANLFGPFRHLRRLRRLSNVLLLLLVLHQKGEEESGSSFSTEAAAVLHHYP